MDEKQTQWTKISNSYIGKAHITTLKRSRKFYLYSGQFVEVMQQRRGEDLCSDDPSSMQSKKLMLEPWLQVEELKHLYSYCYTNYSPQGAANDT